LILTAEEVEMLEGERPVSQRECLYRSIEAHPGPRFALDLGALHYMTSGEIGFLITLKRRIEGRKGNLVLFGVDPYVHDTLRTMRLDTLFNIADTYADALNRFPPGSVS
jgi:anti-sigma B factor antagonist